MTRRRSASAVRAETLTPQVQAREFRRILRRLAEPGARLVEGANRFDLLVRKNRYAKPVLVLAPHLGRALIAEGLVIEAVGHWDIAPEGLAYLRRAEAEAVPFEAQHRLTGRRYIAEDHGRGAHHAVNLAESPLTWLASRKGPDGAPLISASHLEAGERLREDYTRAQLMARVTVDWQRPMTGGASSDQGLSINEVALAARQRVGAALHAVGAELEDVLVSVCCHLRGLEEVERAQGWPPRAAKIVLKIALDRLARHYGIIRTSAKPGLRAWSA